MGARTGASTAAFGRPRVRLWVALVPAMLLPAVLAWGYFFLLDGLPAARHVYGVAKLFLLAWPLLILRLFVERPSVPRRGNWKRHAEALPLGLAVGLALAGALLLAMGTPLGDLAREAAPRIHEKARQFGVLEHYALFSLGASLFNATAEEYYWRWFVFGGLGRLLPPVPAHLLAAAAFSAHHLVVATAFFGAPWGPVLGATTALGGLAWSWLYARQGTLAGAWISHLVVDLALMAVGARLMFG